VAECPGYPAIEGNFARVVRLWTCDPNHEQWHIPASRYSKHVTEAGMRLKHCGGKSPPKDDE